MDMLAKISSFFGEYGLAEANPWFLDDKWDSKSQRGLIKVNYKNADKLTAALALIDKIRDQQVLVRTVGASGILKKAEERYLSG